MKFILTALLLISFGFGLSACGEKKDETAAAPAATTPELVLTPPDVYSWKKTDAGFSVQLTEDAGKKLGDLVIANPDKPVDILIYKQKIASTAAGVAPADGRTLDIAPDDAMRQKILLALPAEKENP